MRIFEASESENSKDNALMEAELTFINDKIDIEFEQTYGTIYIYMEFLLMFFSSLLCNIDHGSVPGFSQVIK